VINKEKVEKEKLEEMARQIRIKVVQMIGKSGFGHIGGSMSIVELLTVLYFCEMNILCMPFLPKKDISPKKFFQLLIPLTVFFNVTLI